MKKAKLLSFAFAAAMSLGGLVGCSKSKDESEKIDFAFSVGIDQDYASLEVRATPYQLVVYDNGADEANGDSVAREYTYKSSNPSVASVVPTTGAVIARTPGTVRFTVSESVSGLEAYKVMEVIPAAEKATGGYNYAAAATEADINKRTEILGKLEKYAMDTHLTGISLFENGGYMLYSSRANSRLENRTYVTGFGYGLLSDSEAFTDPLPGTGRDTQYPLHYHTASSSDPLTINALDAAGSQVSDLSSYITSSYFGLKLNSSKTKAIWYPVLADAEKHPDDPVTKNPKMYHLDEKNSSGMYTGWRIYLRTNVAYRYNGSAALKSIFDNRQVTLADYEFILRFLLTGSHNLKRGNEMAADTSYGIKGANTYNALTKSGMNDDECRDLWNSMTKEGKLGIKTGHADGNEDYDDGAKYPEGDYIEFRLINPIDSFTAMYTLSSSLYSPIPEEFALRLGEKKDGGSDKAEIKRAAKRYGTFNNNDEVKPNFKNNIVESTICLGAYYLEKWEKESRTVFTHNTNWYEYAQGRYQIEGVRIKIDKSVTENTDAYYDEFKAGNLDACSLPQKHMDEKNNPNARQVPGDSVFKLNVNSCTQEQWTERFGPSGSISAGHSWNVKPWMSNDSFLNGLFWSIDRKAFAEKRGVEPSINYFSGAYMSNPQENISYNSTQAHIDAVKGYHNVRKVNGVDVDDYGYNKDTAINYFKTAVTQLVKQGKLNYGTADNPNEIKIEIWWMYQSDISDYGVDIKGYFESAFNDPAVSQNRIKLNVVNNAVTVWEYVYDQHLQVGEFDLGFGAISGNTYNPLNFLEVLKSDNSSTFTLNWGADTSVVDDKHPLVYGEAGQERKYSFDALWEVADHGGVVKEGVGVKPVEKCYLDSFTTLKKDPVTVSNETIGDGSSATVSATLAQKPVIKGSVTITSGSIEIVEDEDAEVAGTLIGPGLTSGSIDYATGAVNLVFDAATGEDVVITYQYGPESNVKLNYKFIDVENTHLAIESISLYVYGGRSFGESEGVTLKNGRIYITYEAQREIEKSIQKANKWDVDSYTGDEKTKDHLIRECYKKYWVFDVTYSLQIGGGQSTLNSIAAGKTSSDKLYN